MLVPGLTVASDFWRAEAVLAINGLRHPPARQSHSWSQPDRQVFDDCAVRLGIVAGSGHVIEPILHAQMERALRRVRWRLLERDPQGWPEIAPRSSGVAPIDFSVLVGWGAESWFLRLAKRIDPGAIAAQIAAVRVVAAVAVALGDAVRRCTRTAG